MPITTNQLEEVSAGRVLKAIARHCVAMRVSVHGMGKERQIDARVSLDGEEVSGEICNARARMIPKAISSKLDAIAGRARRLPLTRGVSFPGGSYLVPIGTDVSNGPASQVFQLIKDIRVEYREAALELKPLWEAHVEKLKSEKVYAQLEKYLVDGDSFVNKHSIDLQLMPLGGAPADMHERICAKLAALGIPADRAEAVSLEICDMVDSAAVAGVGTEDHTVTWLKEVQEMTSKAAAAAVANMIAEPVSEFVESIAGLERSLASNRGVRNDSLDRARRAFDKLQSFDFIMPADVRRRAANLGTRLRTVQANEVNGWQAADVAASLAEAIRSVREELTSSEAQSMFMSEFQRTIDL